MRYASPQTRKVVVGLEFPETAQQAIDAFVASDGGKVAQRELLATATWQNEFKDGRSSEAMFRLIERLRRMRAAGADISVVAFRPASFDSRPTPLEFEERMADLVRAAASADSVVLVLVGNTHARRTETPWPPQYMPMAGHLPDRETLSLDIVGNGGEAWNCQGQPMECAAHPVGAPPEPHARGVRLQDRAATGSPYDGALFVGSEFSASAPQEAR